MLDMVRFSTAASPAQAYTLTVPERRVAKLDLNIPAGRGTIYVIAGNGAIAASRNTDLDGNAAIETTIPAGEYRLAIASPTDPPPAFVARGTLRVPPECPVTELALGVTTDGRIESTDCRYFEFTPFLTANTRSKRYGFSLSEPSRVVMEMSSTEIEPVLVVTTAEERILGTGVAPAPTTLRLTGTLPAGSYRLAATAARGGLGAFTVLVQAQSASATSALSGANDFAGIVEAIPDAVIDGAAPAPLNWHGPKPPKNRPQ